MAKFPEVPEFSTIPRGSKNVINQRKEIDRVDDLIEQVKILSTVVNQLVEELNSQNKPAPRRTQTKKQADSEE